MEQGFNLIRKWLVDATTEPSGMSCHSGQLYSSQDSHLGKTVGPSAAFIKSSFNTGLPTFSEGEMADCNLNLRGSCRPWAEDLDPCLALQKERRFKRQMCSGHTAVPFWGSCHLLFLFVSGHKRTTFCFSISANHVLLPPYSSKEWSQPWVDISKLWAKMSQASWELIISDTLL